jgi:hypothetical protein
MIAEAKKQYRGVLCLHCHQPIPLSSSAVRNEADAEEDHTSDREGRTTQSFTLRCRTCEGEGLYTGLDVVACDGTPRIRKSPARKLPPTSERIGNRRQTAAGNMNLHLPQNATIGEPLKDES